MQKKKIQKTEINLEVLISKRWFITAPKLNKLAGIKERKLMSDLMIAALYCIKSQILLEGQEPDFAARVLRIVRWNWFGPNDPLFTILISTSTLKRFCRTRPNNWRQLFEYQEMFSSLSAYEAAKGTEKKTDCYSSGQTDWKYLCFQSSANNANSFTSWTNVPSHPWVRVLGVVWHSLLAR